MCFKSNSMINLARAIKAHGHTNYFSVRHTQIMQTDKVTVRLQGLPGPKLKLDVLQVQYTNRQVHLVHV